VPITIGNLTTYRNPQLFRKENGRWKKIDQHVHGKDFWQTEYNASNGTWEITFNVDMDSPDDARKTVEFRFENY